MKSIFIVSITIVMLSACKKEKTNSTAVSMDMVDSTAQVAYRGVFGNGPFGSIMGVAKIYSTEKGYSLVLDSFNVSNGPDLHVYLSKQVQPVNFIDLGVLRTTSGRQTYPVNGMPDFTEYKYALIHCQQYNHLFGSANLQ